MESFGRAVCIKVQEINILKRNFEMNESNTISYYENIAEILHPRWRDEVRIGELLNLDNYIDLDKLGKVDYHDYKIMLSQLREFDRAVVELARCRSQNSNQRIQRELRELEHQLKELKEVKSELQTEKRELEAEINCLNMN